MDQGDFAGIVRAAHSRPSLMLLLHAWAAPQNNSESRDGTGVGSLSASRLGAKPDLWSRDLGGIILNIRRLRGANHSVPPILLRGVSGCDLNWAIFPSRNCTLSALSLGARGGSPALQGTPQAEPHELKFAD